MGQLSQRLVLRGRELVQRCRGWGGGGSLGVVAHGVALESLRNLRNHTASPCPEGPRLPLAELLSGSFHRRGRNQRNAERASGVVARGCVVEGKDMSFEHRSRALRMLLVVASVLVVLGAVQALLF